MASSWLIVLLLIIIIPATIYVKFLIPPSDWPKALPSVPFYVTLLTLFKDVDQVELYKTYMEEPIRKYGAVKMFFGARWNIVVGRASLLQEIFKREDVYQKSGNQKKIPYSVLADYTGDNIISAHGSDWNIYSKILKPGLQKSFNLQPLSKNTHILIDLLLATHKTGTAQTGVVVGPVLQRYSLTCLSQSLLETDFGTLEDPNNAFHRMQMALKADIFSPLFLSFPILDRLPIPSRTLARKRVDEFREQLARTVLQSHEDIKCTLESDQLSRRLIAARNSGMLSEKQFLDNLIIMFVAGHENPQVLMISALYLLAKHPMIQSRLREEVFSSNMTEADHRTLQSLPLLNSVILEALRMFPPLSQVINRRTAAPVVLGGALSLPQNIYLGYNCYAAGRDTAVWGIHADEFDPYRWGKTISEISSKYRLMQSRAEFPAFHGGRRACLGERFALVEMRVFLWELVRAMKWELDPTWEERMTPAGPLYPRGLKLMFHSIQSK